MPRTRFSLDGYWEFIPDPLQQFDPDALPQTENVRRIRVPGPWQAQFQDLRDYTGVAWYRFRFTLPHALVNAPVPNPTYILHFGAVDYFTAAWLNGKYIDANEGGYLPFEFILNRGLTLHGTNELVVRVLDPGAAGDLQGETEVTFGEIPHGKQSWYGPISGIWQSVYLEARAETHITQLHVTPDVINERARVDIELNQAVARPLRIQLTLINPLHQLEQHEIELDAHARTFSKTLEIPNPLLWDTHTPHLYEIRAHLAERDETPLDDVRVHFGMRSISTSADGHLMLNGRPLYLRGALDQDYYPEMIYTPFSDAELDRQFAQARHMGLNCLRTHIKITDPRYYDAADRAGILIWTELPNWENLTPTVKRRAQDTLEGMIRRDWNHPSIIIWTIVNESWGVELAVNPDHRQWLLETYDIVKGLDPFRLVVGNSACFTNFHVVTDIQDFHNYYSIPDHYRQWRDWVENFSARPTWVYAHEYDNITAWRAFLRDPWNPLPRALARQVRRTGNEPLVISEFGNWGLPDVEKLRACHDGQDPWWFETGSEWSDGSVYPHAVQERFKLWRLDQVFGDLSSLARASQWMQFYALKYQIEQIRLHPSIVGYIITEFTDVHWESNGLLDQCRNPKVHYDMLANINGADALVPSWTRIVFWEGEECSIPLTLSHFSLANLENSRMDWSLAFGTEKTDAVSDRPAAFLEQNDATAQTLDAFSKIKGSVQQLNPLAANITKLGTISFRVPRLDSSTRVELKMELFDAQENLVTRNTQTLYFFPARHEIPTIKIVASPDWQEPLRALGYALTEDFSAADVIVVSTMTDELRAYVQRGGRALWIAQDKDAQQTFLGPVEIQPREGRKWQGDWASNFNWIRQDKLFQDLPTHRLVDFAFADLTPEYVITGFHPRDFGADVYAGLFIGWIHHTVALIGRRRIGDGELWICTFRLREHITSEFKHPVATILLRDMLQKIASRRTVEAEVGSAL